MTTTPCLKRIAALALLLLLPLVAAGCSVHSGEKQIFPICMSLDKLPDGRIQLAVQENSMAPEGGYAVFSAAGDSFEQALESRAFEPDAPNFTPRISCMFHMDGADFRYKMSILKSEDAEGSACARYVYSYQPLSGLGHFIHTYEGDGNPLPSFAGEPKRVSIPDSIDEFTSEIWNSLNADNRISLYVRYTEPESGKYEERLINKNK